MRVASWSWGNSTLGVHCKQKPQGLCEQGQVHDPTPSQLPGPRGMGITAMWEIKTLSLKNKLILLEVR